MNASIRGLTLWRPWAWAMTLGSKRVENRDWPCPPPLLGGWIALHAGKRWDYDKAAMRTFALRDVVWP